MIKLTELLEEQELKKLRVFDSDASGSSQFFTKFVHGTDTITAYGYQLTGSSYAECHYVVFRP